MAEQAKILAEGLQQVKHLVMQALRVVPDPGKQKQSFLNIKQGLQKALHAISLSSKRYLGEASGK